MKSSHTDFFGGNKELRRTWHTHKNNSSPRDSCRIAGGRWEWGVPGRYLGRGAKQKDSKLNTTQTKKSTHKLKREAMPHTASLEVYTCLKILC